MNNLDELKELWQKQPVGNIVNFNFKDKLPDILNKLSEFERKQSKINTFKVVVVVILVFLIGFIVGNIHSGFFGITGLLLMMGSLGWFMLVYLKKQFRVSELNLNDTSSKFLDYVILRLNEQKKIFKVHFQYFAFILMAGLNFLYLDIYSNYSIDMRLTLHIGMTLFLIVIYLG